MFVGSNLADRQTTEMYCTIGYMLESMKYIGTQETYVAFVTPSMSHAELRSMLSLEAIDAGFISFREKQRVAVWGDSVSLRLAHDSKRNGIASVWYAIYWELRYPHLVMTPNKELQLRMATELEQGYAWMDVPVEMHLSDATPKVLDCTDDYGNTRNYGPWVNTWDPMLTRTMFKTDAGTKVKILADDKPAR